MKRSYVFARFVRGQLVECERGHLYRGELCFDCWREDLAAQLRDLNAEPASTDDDRLSGRHSDPDSGAAG